MYSFFAIAFSFFFLSIGSVFAESNDFYLTPQAEDPGDYLRAVQRVSASGGHVRDQYDEESYNMGGSAENRHNLGNQMASGIMNRNSLIDYFVYAMRFLSQMALLIGAVMIIYTGYLYASSAINGEQNMGKIQDAVYGIVIIIFAYAIVRILIIAFLK